MRSFKQAYRLISIEVVFVFWYIVGLTLMLTVSVPDSLLFANGLFNLFYAAYVWKMEADRYVLRSSRYLSILRLAVIGICTWGIEAAGVATGKPFGEYTYTSVLGVSVLGVPLAIAAAWIAVIGNVVLMFDRLSGIRVYGTGRTMESVHRTWNRIAYLFARALFAGVCAVVLDLVLDPVAYAREFWIWNSGAMKPAIGMIGAEGVFGIPWSNFIAWGLIAALFSLLYPLPRASFYVDASGFARPFRLYQAILWMFGVLGLAEGLTACFVIAVAAIAATEGGLQYARSQQERLVRSSIRTV